MKEIKQTDQIHMGRLIHMVSHQLKRHNISPAENSGLTNIQRNILGFVLLESVHRAVYQKDLEEGFHIRKSTASGILQLLEKNGFIVRESEESDARLKRILPTPKAEVFRREVLGNIQKLEKRLAKSIPEEDYQICKRVLQQMLRNLMEDNEENE